MNYVPVRPDMMDIREKIDWMRQNDDIVLQITKNANKFAETVFTQSAMEDYIA